MYLFLFQIITIRNETMHSPDLSLKDKYTTDSLHKMVEFLKTVHCGMQGNYDTDDCQKAIAEIKTVSYC